MNCKGHGTIRRARNRAGTSGPRLAHMKETPRRIIAVTSSLNEISTDQLGSRVVVRGGGVTANALTHKVLTYTEHHSVCPLVGLGTPPTLLPQASVPSPPDQRVGGHTRLQLRGWGSSNSDAGEKA